MSNHDLDHRDKSKGGNGENGGNGDHNLETFLYIRTNPADNGSTPLPAGLPWWVSPDITIIRPNGTSGSEGAVGEADQVEVIVTNGGGIDATNAYVDAFLADPSTIFTPATATLVGSGYLPTIPSYSTAFITFPWVPTVSEAGHRCMLARVCLSMPPDCYANAAIFDVPGDRHVAQRNLNVVNMKGDTLSFRFLVVNPLGKEGVFRLRTREVHIGRSNAEFVRGALRSRFAQFGQAPLGGIGLTLGEPAPLMQEPGAAAAFPTGVLRKGLEVPKAKTVHLEMPRDERRYAVLTVARNPRIRSGDLSVVEVTQIEVNTERTMGALWMVVKN